MALAAQHSQGDHARRRGKTQRKLLAAVEQLIADGESYANVSVERLAGAAGISRATFYVYFDGKGDLLHAWLDETIAELRHDASALLAVDPSAPHGDLAEALRALIGHYRERASVMAAILDEATRDGSLRAEVDGAIAGAIAALTAYIERGQRAGWADPELMARETAAWLVWLLERGLNHVVPGASDERLQALAGTLAQMGQHTLRA